MDTLYHLLFKIDVCVRPPYIINMLIAICGMLFHSDINYFRACPKQGHGLYVLGWGLVVPFYLDVGI